MKTSGGLPYRRSVRIPGFDYEGYGPYFVTTDAFGQRCIFGDVMDGVMHLNELGVMVRDEWLRTLLIRPYVELDDFQVMPNHMHAIIDIRASDEDEGAGRARRAPTLAARFNLGSRSLGSIIGGFKATTTSAIRRKLRDESFRVWQRGFYETVIRDEIHLDQVRDYIQSNPANWRHGSGEK